MKKYPSLYFNVQEFTKLFEMKTGVAVAFKFNQTAFHGDAQKVQQAQAAVEEASKLQFPQSVEKLFGPPVVWSTAPQQVAQAYTIMSWYNPRPNGHHFIRFNTNPRSVTGVLSWSDNPQALQDKIKRWEEILVDVKESRNHTATVDADVNPLSYWYDLKEFELHNSSLVRPGANNQWLVWAETQGVADVAAKKLKTPLPLLDEPNEVRFSSTSPDALRFLQQALDALIKPEDPVVNWASPAGEDGSLVLRSRLPQTSTVLDKLNQHLAEQCAELIQVPTATQAGVDALVPVSKFSLVTLNRSSPCVLFQAANRRAMQAAKDQIIGLQQGRAVPAPPTTAEEVRRLAPTLDLTIKSSPAVSFTPPSTLPKASPVQPKASPVQPKTLAPVKTLAPAQPKTLAPKIDLTASKPQVIASATVRPLLNLTAKPAPTATPKPATTVLAPKQRLEQQKVSSPAPVSISVQPGTVKTIVSEIEPPTLPSAGPISFVTDVQLAEFKKSAPIEVRELAPTRDFTKPAPLKPQRPVLNLLDESITTVSEVMNKERPRIDLTAVNAKFDGKRPAFRFGSQFAVRIDIPSEYVGKLIGRGGSGMREIEAQTNARVKFQDEQDFSVCNISAQNDEDLKHAEELIRTKLAQYEADDADLSSKRGQGGANQGGFRRRNNDNDDVDNDDDFVRENPMEDADGFIDHQAPIIDPEFMKRMWFKHKEDPKRYTNEALVEEFNVEREDVDAIMSLMALREQYVALHGEDAELMDDSYEKLNAEHMGVYTPSRVGFDEMPRPFLTPKLRFVTYNSELACKNYHFASNSDELASNREEYIHLPGIHLVKKPKPEKVRTQVVADGWLINCVTTDDRNLRNSQIKQWHETGAEARKQERVRNNQDLLVREGLIQVGHGKFSRVGHYSSVLPTALLSKLHA
ncbi:hypothetical protein BASA81_002680 [Batrachochytrium salamandrivorans]|nr:hypothetical protein BASA81_002680 [Batrachochytrium salamandrivorans]